MKLRTKLNLFVCLNALIGLLLVSFGFSYIIIQNQFQEKGDQALRLAETVASTPQIIAAFGSPNPSSIIQPLTERISKEMGAEFIVVANMNLIRYSHPNPHEIGQKMIGADDHTALEGRPSISKAVGTLGLSIRGRAPIFAGNGHQIGVVSVGFLVSDIWAKIFISLSKIIGFGIVGLVFSVIGAYLLSGHVKRQIFGMEPSEIAHMAQEQAAILQSIHEGVLAVDSNGRITACNHQAKRILCLEDVELLGESLTGAVPHARLCEVVSDGPNYIDQPMVIGNTLIVVNRVPVLLNDQVIGSVMTFRDKMQLDQMERRLEDIERYADALRSQRHEFMNRLHTISGLIHLKEYDLVCELIDEVNSEQQHLLTFFANRIRDPAVIGIIIGKIHRARELGIRLHVDPKSWLSELCVHREVVVTVLGNAIDNALEACMNSRMHRDPVVTVYINDEAEQLELSVRDSGPGIDPQLGERIFDDGVTSKGTGRGFGLSLCSQMVANIGGQLGIVSSVEGATLEMVLPKGAAS